LWSQRISKHDPAMRNEIHWLKKLAVLSGSLMLTVCGFDNGDPDTPPAGQEYVVGFGETIRIAGMSLEFTTLAEDSRCPGNATCEFVYEGNVRVLVTATRARVTNVLELNLNPRFPVRAVFEGHVIELRNVEPYPMTTGPYNPQNYTLTLFVDVAPT